MSSPTAPSATARPIFLSPSAGEHFRLLNEEIRILADGSATRGQCVIFVESTKPGDGPPLHRHSVDDEFFFILEGSYRFLVEGQNYVAEPGAFLFAPRGSVHTFQARTAGPGGLCRMLVVCTPSGLEGPFRETAAAQQRGPLTPEQLAEIFGKFNLTSATGGGRNVTRRSGVRAVPQGLLRPRRRGRLPG